MGTHDLIFKRLLQHFFGDLLRIVLPRVAARVRTDAARFLNPEMFTPRRHLRRVDLPAREFLRRPEPLAWALAALMDPGGWPPERHKLECRRAIARGDLDEQSRYLLEDCVETYLQLERESKMRYEESMHREGVVPFDEIKMSWSEKIALEATEKGHAEGLEKGHAEGLEKGRREEARRLVLRQLERRFGPLEAGVHSRVEAIDSLDELERLADRVLDASSLDEMGLA